MPSIVNSRPDHGLPQTITSFVEGMSTNLARFPLLEQPEILEEARRIVQDSCLSAKYQKLMQVYIRFTYQLAIQIYGSTPHETKVFITLFCAAMYLCDDDMPEELVPAFEDFALKFNTGVSHDDSSLNFIEELLCVHAPRIAGPITLSALIKGTFDCIIGCIIEKRMRAEDAAPLSREYPVWLRRKLSISEAMAYLLFPEATFPERRFVQHYLPFVPSLARVIDETNDILSAYKEMVVGDEMDNLVGNLAIANETSIEQTARDMATRMIALKSRMIKMAITSRSSVVTPDIITGFCDGWIAWHLSQSKRYKLDQLGLTL